MEELTPITRREVFLAKASGQDVETPTPVTREEVFLDAIAKGGGGGGGEKFIVTLTPTAADFSGTMDKTVAEINAAYEAGQEIVFRIYAAATLYYDFPCSNVEANSANNYFIMGAFGIMNDLLILFKTHDQEGDGTGQTYKTTIYSLTPAS